MRKVRRVNQSLCFRNSVICITMRFSFLKNANPHKWSHENESNFLLLLAYIQTCARRQLNKKGTGSFLKSRTLLPPWPNLGSFALWTSDVCPVKNMGPFVGVIFPTSFFILFVTHCPFSSTISFGERPSRLVPCLYRSFHHSSFGGIFLGTDSL